MWDLNISDFGVVSGSCNESPMDMEEQLYMCQAVCVCLPGTRLGERVISIIKVCFWTHEYHVSPH